MKKLEIGFFAVEESSCQGGAGDGAGGKAVDEKPHEGVVCGEQSGTLSLQVSSIRPVVGVDETVGNARQLCKQKHDAAVEQFVGMDDVIPAVHQDLPQPCAVGIDALGLAPGDQVDLSAQCPDLRQVVGIGVRGGKIDLKFGFVSLAQQVHELIFDAADAHGTGNDQNFDLFHRYMASVPGWDQPASLWATRSMSQAIRRRTGVQIIRQNLPEGTHSRWWFSSRHIRRMARSRWDREAPARCIRLAWA